MRCRVNVRGRARMRCVCKGEHPLDTLSCFPRLGWMRSEYRARGSGLHGFRLPLPEGSCYRTQGSPPHLPDAGYPPPPLPEGSCWLSFCACRWPVRAPGEGCSCPAQQAQRQPAPWAAPRASGRSPHASPAGSSTQARAGGGEDHGSSDHDPGQSGAQPLAISATCVSDFDAQLEAELCYRYLPTVVGQRALQAHPHRAIEFGKGLTRVAVPWLVRGSWVEVQVVCLGQEGSNTGAGMQAGRD